jgi:hypothetical protein
MSLSLVRAGRYSVTLLEKGPHIASHIQDHWPHVDLFSSNALNMSITGKEVISEQKGTIPDQDAYYSGGKFVETYLQPLAEYLGASDRCEVRLNTAVVSVGRKEAPKHKQVPGRSSQPFLLLCSHLEDEYYLEADAGEFFFIMCCT